MRSAKATRPSVNASIPLRPGWSATSGATALPSGADAVSVKACDGVRLSSDGSEPQPLNAKALSRSQPIPHRRAATGSRGGTCLAPAMALLRAGSCVTGAELPRAPARSAGESRVPIDRTRPRSRGRLRLLLGRDGLDRDRDGLRVHGLDLVADLDQLELLRILDIHVDGAVRAL